MPTKSNQAASRIFSETARCSRWHSLCVSAAAWLRRNVLWLDKAVLSVGPGQCSWDVSPACPCSRMHAASVSNAILVWLKKRPLVKNAVEWSHVSATDCAAQQLWRAHSQAEILIIFIIVSGAKRFFRKKRRIHWIDSTLCQQKLTKAEFFFLAFQRSSPFRRPNLARIIPAVTVISSLCWSLCPFKDSVTAASPNPKG